MARSGGAPRRRGAADEFRRRVAAHYGGEPPAEGRLYLGLVEGTSADGNYRVRVGKGVYPLPPAQHAVGRPLERQGRRQRQEARLDGRRAAPGDVIWVKNAHQSKRARFSDWTYDGKSEVQWLPAYDETARGKAPKRPRRRWS